MSSLLRCLAMLLPGTMLFAQQRIPLDGTWHLIDGREITVPAAFETTLGTDFDGVARYRLKLPLPPTRTAHADVEFAAVATQATVFCNGTQVCQHLGGWTPFRVDVSGALHWDGNDVLEVEVDERVGHNTQGFLPIVQPHFGGIWQGVQLVLTDGPRLDPEHLLLFGRANGELLYSVATLGAAATVELTVLDGERTVSTTRFDVDAALPTTGVLQSTGVQPWSPHHPALYTVRLALRQGERTLDQLERRIGFRTLHAEGSRIEWNGEPLQVRGVLHWGYSAPLLAPPVDREYWRQQLVALQGLGFNCLKCCLWVPPPCVYELCDELGLLVWQEYPTWHPQMDAAHKQELLREYGEFFLRDRNHPSVAFRSITCETGQGADFDVVKALFTACKDAVPDTLVVDDSSWIGWQRITDFWDEHPYGNNSWLPGRIEDFRKFIAEKGAKPLLLGECIAADTWFDAAAFTRVLAANDNKLPWWRPGCWQAQLTAERWLTDRFGAATLASLSPLSRDFALQNRKFQIERLRLSMPDAGFVVSVVRDFPKARMGLFDDFGALKWTAQQWQWNRDTMLCLDLPGASRTLAGNEPRLPVRISHFGEGPLRGVLQLTCDLVDSRGVEANVELAPGTVSAPIELPIPNTVDHLTRVRVTAELRGTHPAHNSWDVWLVPTSMPEPHVDVQHVDALTPQLLDQLEAGACVVLHAGDRPGSLRTESMWSLRGAVFAPPHPFDDLVPRDALLELAAFDLESGLVMPWQQLRDEIDPMLAFWETHDIEDVRFHLLLGECGVGRGRLAVTTLRLDDGTAIGQYIGERLDRHLQQGPAPRHSLSATTLAAMRGRLREQKIDLPVWRFRTDPANQGRAGRWNDPATDAATADWRDLRAGSHWENQAEDLRRYDGVAWYRVDVDIPESWRDQPARAVFEGVDDSFEFWLNGEPAGSFGDEATKTSIWLERQVAELGTRLRAGQRNTLVLRVVDQGGAGGLWKPVFLTTGPADAKSTLLH